MLKIMDTNNILKVFLVAKFIMTLLRIDSRIFIATYTFRTSEFIVTTGYNHNHGYSHTHLLLNLEIA